MTEFAETLRHLCRNPRCRSKLPTSVTNPREAFCSKGCRSSFYRKRCVICEGKMVRKTGNQLVCGKRPCRNALRAQKALGRHLLSSDAKLASKTLDFIDPKLTPKPDLPWRFVAGPKLSPSARHCATVGAGEAVEANNRTNARHWREYNAAAEARCSIKRDDVPVNVVGGYKFPGAPVVDLAPFARPSPPTANDSAASHGDPLDIPAFLRRTVGVDEPERMVTAERDLDYERANTRPNPKENGEVFLSKSSPMRQNKVPATTLPKSEAA
jgi:hypothetical protein